MIHNENTKGVSPIISVILMVALAILVASIVSGFAFELAGTVLQSPITAGLSFSESFNPAEGTYDVEIVWSSEGTADQIYAIDPNGSVETARIDGVGQEININGVEPNEDIRVIGSDESGTEQVIQTYNVGN